MEANENIAGLGKNHDEEAKNDDIAKKQSQAAPAEENIDVVPNSINPDPPIHQEAENYAKEEHQKAKDWETMKPEGLKATGLTVDPSQM